MSDLIKALQIFLKYGDPYSPTHCDHDALWVNIDPHIVSEEDKKILDDLGFFPDDFMFLSYRFGSC